MESERVANHQITRLLVDWQTGDEQAGNMLMRHVYHELKLISDAYLRKENQRLTLQSTELVNELFLRLIDQKQIDWRDRAHFFGIAARMMRQIIVEKVRARRAAKRGEGKLEVVFIEDAGNLLDSKAANTPQALDFERLDDALKAFALLDERKALLVDLKFFGGLSIEEIAEALNISHATVKRDWNTAKAWLHRFMMERS